MSDACASASALIDTGLPTYKHSAGSGRVLGDGSGRAFEPLLITMEDLQHTLGCGKTMAFAIVGSGQIETVMVGRKRMPVWESVKTYVTRLREANVKAA